MKPYLINMINILEKFLAELPEHLSSSNGWSTLNMNNHEPVIERVYKIVGDKGQYRLCLNKIYKSDAELLFHNHSWPFAVKMFCGEYEMGVGISKDGKKPEVNAVMMVSPGVSYDMSNMDMWHYTKPISDYTYSVMVIDDSGRWRPQTCNFDGLSEEKEEEILAFFRNYFKDEIASL